MNRALRMPRDSDEAQAVYTRWDRLNGRYYIKADVRLGDGRVYRDVVFDGDRYVAVEINGQAIYGQPEFFEQQVLEFVVTSDYSPGRRFTVATREERAAFHAK
jgi:hypothetical protein